MGELAAATHEPLHGVIQPARVHTGIEGRTGCGFA